MPQVGFAVRRRVRTPAIRLKAIVKDREMRCCNRVAGAGLLHPLGKGIPRAPGVLAVKEKSLPMQFIGAALGLHVHAPARRPVRRGLHVAGRRLDRADRRLADRRIHALRPPPAPFPPVLPPCPNGPCPENPALTRWFRWSSQRPAPCPLHPPRSRPAAGPRPAARFGPGRPPGLRMWAHCPTRNPASAARSPAAPATPAALIVVVHRRSCRAALLRGRQNRS